MTGKPRAGGLWYLIGTAILCVAAVVSAWLLSRDVPGALSEVDAPAVPVSAPVTQTQASHSMSATLTVDLRAVPPIVAPPDSGTVTAVEARPGTELKNGDWVYSVDNRRATAYSGDTVFYRTLQQGDKGDDVAQLQRILDSLLPEWSVNVDGDFGPGTRAAVVEWEKRLGIALPTGVFSPAWFVRLPAEPYVVDEAEIQVGAPFPAAGEEVATGLAQPARATVESLEGEGAPLGAYLFTFEGKTLPVDHTDADWEVSNLVAALEVSGRPSEGTQAKVDGNLRLAEENEGLAVPAVSVISGADGTCVAVLSGDSDYDMVSVLVIDGQIDGSAVVEGDLEPGEQVLMNPGEILGGVGCP